MQKMIAAVKFNYRGVALAVGDEFDADDEHVKLFTLIGHAHVPGRQEYDTRVMTAGHNMRARRQRMRSGGSA